MEDQSQFEVSKGKEDDSTSETSSSVKKEPISDDECEMQACSSEGSQKLKKSKTAHHEFNNDDPASGDSAKKITLIVKTTKEKHKVLIGKEATVKELKEEVSKVYEKPVEQLCLIFSGKILKDAETLSSNSITDGLTVHLLIRSHTKTDPFQVTASIINASPFGLNSFGGLPGLANLRFGSPNFMDLQQQMQRELMNNPEFLRQVMENPFVQNLMSNPDVMTEIVHSNPEMQRLMEHNPEIGRMLNNREVLRQTIQVARNPTMLQAFMQSGASVSSIPKRAEANKKDEKPQSPPPSKLESESASSEQKDPAIESTGSGDQSSPAHTGGLFNTPGLQSIMQQMVQNPQLIQEMMAAPYMQTMMEAMTANPDVAAQVMINNPVFGNNPQMQEQFKKVLPVLIQQMQNPEYRSFVTNPQALTAMMNIHQGLDQLQHAAPNMFNMFPGQPPFLINPQPATPGNNDSQAEDKTDNSETNGSYSPQNSFSQFMGYMINSMARRNSNLPPEERYQGELQQLQAMGFLDKEVNLQALIATVGDVNAAIERILSSQN